MGRKITATMFGASILFPSLAGAFGLGEITLNSALNQPLNADISISKVGSLTESEIITKLAPAVEFERAGVDRAYFLNDIKFEVVLDNKGGAIVQLTTRKSLVEPFLNFIVEVRWPEGKLLREYTLLLDPPVFSDEAYQQLTAASSSASSQAPVADKSRDKPSPAVAKASAGPVTGNTSTSVPETYGPVGPADSLWKIAEKVRSTKSVSIQQTMLALQRENPDAFINNNINLLKQGKVLRVPDLTDIRSGNHQSAVEDVRKQNKGWKNKARAATVEKKGEAVAAQLGSEAARVPDKKVEGEARLKLVAAINDGDLTTAVLGASDGGASEAQADVAGLQQSLQLKEESLDKALLKNEDLQSRFEEINEQIKTSEELITLKDDQISVLQK
ncbi:MAG: peptigoglycan-binding protein LysM, partial [Gammaproteobacteria bacterium]|nr:peptigoglycan-binding protein LysM [Gammaproteobacteria bacterium]